MRRLTWQRRQELNLRVFKTLLPYVVVFLATLFLVASCSEGSTARPGQQASVRDTVAINGKTPTNGTLQKNNEGAIAVTAQWMGEKDESLVFGISMNTHSVNLDQYDLAGLAVLKDDGGNEYQQSSWISESGGHHREGTLVFPIPDSIRQSQARYIKIIIKGIDGVNERVFEWTL